VDAQGAVDAAAGEADEDAQVDGRPRGVARLAVGALLVAGLLDQQREGLLVALVLLAADVALGIVHGWL